jgi:glycosyltransferase involved in cell wall biosynthesis
MDASVSSTYGSSSEPSLTVIIASKNRLPDIRLCLSSIRHQITQPDDIIIVDQSTSRYDLSDFYPLVHLHSPHLSGLTAARNVALDLVRTELVLFLDDDVELTTDCVAPIKADFVSRANAVGLGLNITWPERTGTKARLWSLVFEHGFFNRSPIKRPDGTQLRRLVGCAMAYRAWLFSKERFDELLLGYALGEDWEFSARSRCHGELWRCERAKVVHHVSSANRLTRQRARKDLMRHFLYFYEKLGAKNSIVNRFWKVWWIFGEALRWLTLGMGIPRTDDGHLALDNLDKMAMP